MTGTNQLPPLPTLRPGDSNMESLIEAAIQGHASTREAMRWLVRQLVPLQAQATQAEVTDADIVAVMRDGNNCNYNDEAEHIQFARAILDLRPAAVPMTDKPIADAVAAEREACAQICDSMPYRVASARKAARAIRERGITAQAKRETP